MLVSSILLSVRQFNLSSNTLQHPGLLVSLDVLYQVLSRNLQEVVVALR
jgi:hypothetical protein